MKKKKSITGCHTFPLVPIKPMWPLFIQLTLHTKTNFVWHLITYKKKWLPSQLWYKLLWLNTSVISYIICCQIARSVMKVHWHHNLDTSFQNTHTHTKLWYINAPDYLQTIILSSQIVSSHLLPLIITSKIHKTACFVQWHLCTKLPSPTHPFRLYKFVLCHLSYFLPCYRETARDRGIWKTWKITLPTFDTILLYCITVTVLITDQNSDV